LWAYCRQDVLAEEAISEALPDLSEAETGVFLLDQKINVRGFELDTEAIDAALELIDGEFVELNTELAALTNGQVTRATQRARMLAWLAENGLDLDNSQAETIEEALGRTDLTPPARRGLEIMRLLGKSSTSKVEAMRDWVCPDRRVRGGLLYHGASTGRWTGKGIQPHNFPRGFVKDQDYLWFVLKSRDRDVILSFAPTDKKGNPIYASVMDALSQGLRGVIVPSEGKQLYVADFAGIEARVLLWHAEDEDGLDIFRRDEDIYCSMASSIYGYEVKANPENQPKERALGKVAILGLGYQMGASKFVDTALKSNVVIAEDSNDPNEMTAKRVVEAYREKFWRVKNLWRDQEKGAIKAVQRPGREVWVGKVSWMVEGRFLYCELPSGRRLAYPDPQVQDKLMPWGEEKASLTYMGINQYTRKWTRQNSYGGLLVENIVQATARDLMAEAMVRAEETGVYEPILSVHDEMLAEADEGAGSVHEFNQLMAKTPRWADGCPVAAEGWSGRRYRK
jgi:DNA polymerase bacteriophage-type